MKKVFYILGILSVCLLASCKKDEVGATATVDMAGQWYVTCDGFKDGAVNYEDIYGMGRFLVFTSNTAANVATDMLLSDDRDNPFWDFKLKVKADPATLTFSAQDADNLNYEDCAITVTGGKIVKGGAQTPSGQPADYIEFHIVFSDDDNRPDYYDDLFIHGFRYTGLAADE